MERLFQTIPVATMMRTLFGADKNILTSTKKKTHKNSVIFPQVGLTREGYYATSSYYELHYKLLPAAGEPTLAAGLN